MSIRDAIDFEAHYFKTHDAYKDMADRMGIPFLSSSLNKVLMNHIKRSIP